MCRYTVFMLPMALSILLCNKYIMNTLLYYAILLWRLEKLDIVSRARAKSKHDLLNLSILSQFKLKCIYIQFNEEDKFILAAISFRRVGNSKKRRFLQSSINK